MTYKGMNFREWCALDPDDDRKISYHLKGFWDRKEQEAHFSSDDTIDYMMLLRIRSSIIEKVELIDDVWYATLVY